MQTRSQSNLAKQPSCLIVGGGLSGLIAATVLQRRGIRVTVLDKGRGIGGRLATRRIRHGDRTGVFDYGAQFFTVSDPRFQDWVAEWLQQDVVEAWVDLSNERGQACYRGIQSNRSIAQYLAQDLEVHTQTRVTTVAWDSSQWLIQTEQGTGFQGDRLMMTPPIPQSLALLDDSAIAIPPEFKHKLERVTYQPCIAVLALLEHPSLIPGSGSLRLQDPALSWIACNQKKGISPQTAAVTLQATSEFSQRHWGQDDDAIAKKLFKIAEPWLGSAIVKYQVHRWRYSQPHTRYGQTYLTLHEPGPLVLAGDAFAAQAGESSLNLEKAVLSGLDAAKALLDE